MTYNTGARPNMHWLQINLGTLDQSNFHEISHLWNTDDGEAGNDWNNSGIIAKLMNENFSKWVTYNYEKTIAKKACKKCEPIEYLAPPPELVEKGRVEI